MPGWINISSTEGNFFAVVRTFGDNITIIGNFVLTAKNSN